MYTHRTDHDLDHVDHVDPILDVVQDLCDTYPTQETCATYPALTRKRDLWAMQIM